MSNRLALFDCDGTLVDSQANICAAMAHAFKTAGLTPPDDSATRRIVGLNLVEAVAVLLPGDDDRLNAEVAQGYKDSFLTLRSNGVLGDEPLYDGIAEALDAIEDAGWLLGIATSKSDRGLTRLLDELGLTKRFVTLQTSCRHPSKPHPSMIETAMTDAGAVAETTVMIGDTSFDMAMGGNAGAHALGVLWGYNGHEDLISSGADAVCKHLDGLLEAMERLTCQIANR